MFHLRQDLKNILSGADSNSLQEESPLNDGTPWNEWTPAQVGNWIDHIGLSEVRLMFELNGITGDVSNFFSD